MDTSTIYPAETFTTGTARAAREAASAALQSCPAPLRIDMSETDFAALRDHGTDPAHETDPEREALVEKVDRHFRHVLGVGDHAAYLAHRDLVKAHLRGQAAALKALKARLRYLDGDDADFLDVESAVSLLRSAHRSTIELRRAGKAWSANVARAREAEAA